MFESSELGWRPGPFRRGLSLEPEHLILPRACISARELPTKTEELQGGLFRATKIIRDKEHRDNGKKRTATVFDGVSKRKISVEVQHTEIDRS